MSDQPARTDSYGTPLPPIEESDGALYAAASKQPDIGAFVAEVCRHGKPYGDGCGSCDLDPVGGMAQPDPTQRPECDPYSAGREPSNDGFAPAPPDKTYQHALVRRCWEAQLQELPADIKRLLAEAATELEGHLPATDDFVNSMRRKHAKVIR